MGYDAGVGWEPLIYLAIDFHFLQTVWPATDASAQPLSSACGFAGGLVWRNDSSSGGLNVENRKCSLVTFQPMPFIRLGVLGRFVIQAVNSWRPKCKPAVLVCLCIADKESGLPMQGPQESNVWEKKERSVEQEGENTNPSHQFIKAWPAWLEVMEGILPTNTVL